jgi:hypothetical protein
MLGDSQFFLLGGSLKKSGNPVLMGIREPRIQVWKVLHLSVHGKAEEIALVLASAV